MLNAKLEQLAMANCATKAEILRKAIVLYELAYRGKLKIIGKEMHGFVEHGDED